MNERFKRALIRGARALVAVIIAGLAVKYGDNEIYAIIAPVLMAIDKYVRD